MDVYRIGTVLELIRALVLSLVEDGTAVKVSVQQGMGEGVFQVSVISCCEGSIHAVYGKNLSVLGQSTQGTVVQVSSGGVVFPFD